jgi:23S rRNA (uracil1939-C5)-methyltransferase
LRQRHKEVILTDVEIIDTGAKGKNIGKKDNQVILVSNAVPGDLVDIQITGKKKGIKEGIAINFHRLSEKRMAPFCPHFDHCGGCTCQNMNYESQLFYKQKVVEDALSRIAKVDSIVLPILASPRTEYYRNRLDFAFSNKKWLTPEEFASHDIQKEPGLGFHISGAFDKVIDIKHCFLQEEPSNAIRLAIRNYAIDNNLAFFNARCHEGFLRSLIIRTTLRAELMVILIFYHEYQEKREILLDYVQKLFPQITSLYYVINPKANDTVYDLEHFLYSGSPYITESINEINYRIGPKSFFQTNPWQAVNLFDKAIDFAAPEPSEIIYDLYTGTGSIALQIAGKVKTVIGIETVSEAIEMAKINAADNLIDNALFYAGDVRNVLTQDFIALHGRPDTIITDPPRTGMELEVVEKILDLAPKKIVYVSCNPATQARDILLLKEKYKVDKVQPVDMFPHTWHVENITLLTLIN